MELQTLMAQVLTEDKIKLIAKKANLTPEQTLKVVTTALPVLLEGAKQQNADKTTQEGFAKAVRSHAARDPEEVDTIEGEKIVNHLLSENTTAVKALSKKTGLSQKQVLSILAVLAPIIMNLLGSSTEQESQSGSNTTDLISSLLGGGSGNSGMAGVLLNLLAGSSGSSASSSSAASPLAGMLGSLLTGSGSSGNTSSLGGALLGSLLGGTDYEEEKEDKKDKKDKDKKDKEEKDDDNDNGVDMLSLLMGLLK